jgi:hypothetical protein
MARIRSVHPDICLDETLAEVSARAERTFVRLWTHLDDEGRAKDNPKLIKAALYPLHDDMTSAEVEADIRELIGLGLLLRYEVDGVRVIACKSGSWGERQKPRHPSPSRLPAPPQGYRPPDGTPPPPSGEQRNDRRTVTADRRKPHAGVGVGDGEGVGVTPVDSNGSAPSLTLVPEPASPSATGGSDVQTVFDAWRESTGHLRARLDDKRRKRIKNALKSYPLTDVVAAVRGWRHSPHNRGENERATAYNDIDLLLRDAAHIEKFRDLELGTGSSKAPGEAFAGDSYRGKSRFG